MKKILCFLLLSTSVAFADDSKPPEAVKPSLTVDDINVTLAALQNAGAACDAGLIIYCQITALRTPVEVKLKAALPQVTWPAGKKP